MTSSFIVDVMARFLPNHQLKDACMFNGVRRVALAACMVLLTPLSSAASTQINFATAYAADSFQTENLQRYADEVARVTAGKVNIKLHPAGTLLKPTEIYSGVRSGKTEGGEVIMSSLAKEHPLFGMDALPFIVAGYDDARRLWTISRPGIEKVLTEHGLQLLYAVPWPPQNLYSNREVKSMQDFKGMRMRVYNSASERIAQLIGARPITIQAVDLGKALDEEKFDMMLTSSWTGVDMKAWSKLKYYYQVNAWLPKNMVFISKTVFNRLDADTQQKLLLAARTAEQRGWMLSESTDRTYEDVIRAHGMRVDKIDPLIRSALDRLGETFTTEWLRQAAQNEWTLLMKYSNGRPGK
jgi:TRAP-type C4-dicarboxylate transport system substrate-binding protein